MNKDETTDEALKADESTTEGESPNPKIATEGLDIVANEPMEMPEEPESEQETPEEAPEGAQEGEHRKTASSRIQELVAEKKVAQEAVEKEKQKTASLEDQVRKLTDSFRSPVPQPQPQQAVDGEAEVTVEEVLRRADALAQIRVAQAENLNRINSEAQEAMKLYPELDPDSDSFDSELSEAVSRATLAEVRVNPTTSVKGFVEGLIKPYRRSIDKQVAGQKETIAKQVSEQAVRPSTVSEQEKPFSELSIAEMEKKLGVVYR